MTPVISPWVFYLMPVCERVSVLVFVASLLCLCLTIGFAIQLGCELDYRNPDEDKVKILKDNLKKMIIATTLTAIMFCLMPSEETLTKMVVAQNVTVDRVEMVSDTVVTVYNDIMNLFSGAANG